MPSMESRLRSIAPLRVHATEVFDNVAVIPSIAEDRLSLYTCTCATEPPLWRSPYIRDQSQNQILKGADQLSRFVCGLYLHGHTA